MIDMVIKVSAEAAKKIMEKGGVGEIVFRSANAKFEEFAKYVVNNAKQGQDDIAKACLRKVQKAIEANGLGQVNLEELLRVYLPKDIHKELLHLKTAPNFRMLVNLAKQAGRLGTVAGAANWIGVAMNAANLVATIVSTVIICQKLDQLEAKIDKIGKKIDQAKALHFEWQVRKPCGKLIQEYKVFSHDIEHGRSIDKTRLLDTIKDSYSCIESVLKIRGDYPLDDVLYVVYSLLPAFANMIIIYYRQFYRPEDGLYALHDDWMKLFDALSSKEIQEETRDSFFLNREHHLHNAEVNEIVDLQYLTAQGLKAKITETVEDLKACESREVYQQAFILASQYAMQYADRFREEYAHRVGEEEASRIVDEAKMQMSYAS